MKKFTVDDIKRKLGMTEDTELREFLGYKSTGVISNWKRDGRIPAKALMKIAELSNGAIQIDGDHNHTFIGHGATTKEAEMLCEILESWDEKKRKKLLRMALEMDEEE